MHSPKSVTFPSMPKKIKSRYLPACPSSSGKASPRLFPIPKSVGVTEGTLMTIKALLNISICAAGWKDGVSSDGSPSKEEDPWAPQWLRPIPAPASALQTAPSLYLPLFLNVRPCSSVLQKVLNTYRKGFC